ncbi:hypothetical protein U1Q18_035591 [Sarracenia purpurea var. burkii]
MPTVTKFAWETLFEPRVPDSSENGLNSQQQISKSALVVDDDDGGNYGDKEEENKKKKKKVQTPNHLYITPALYVTPAPAPIPDCSSDPLSPSPYVVNHKRRGGRRVGEFDEAPQLESHGGGINSNSSGGGGDDVVEEAVEDNFLGAETGCEVRNEASVVEDDDFFDPRCDSPSVSSSTDGDDFGKQAECRSYVSNQGEFFDADEVFSSDGSTSNLSSPYGAKIESELRSTRLSLLEEIERRKTAEDAVGLMRSQWQRFASILSKTGLTFPAPQDSTNMQLETCSLEQLCQEIIVARFVAEAIGKGQARAEAEIAAEVIIESKEQEISRLRDRLQYYEAVNHEMCQRNQEVMVARRQRQRKRTQRRWIWSCVGLSVAIGASVIAYSFLPQTSEHHQLPSSIDSSDASCIASAESANKQ